MSNEVSQRTAKNIPLKQVDNEQFTLFGSRDSDQDTLGINAGNETGKFKEFKNTTVKNSMISSGVNHFEQIRGENQYSFQEVLKNSMQFELHQATDSGSTNRKTSLLG